MKRKNNDVARTSMENVIFHLFIDRIRKLAAKDENYLKKIPGFLINPKKIEFFWFDEHIAISFGGNDREKTLKEIHKPQFSHREFFSAHKKTYIFSAVSGLDLKKSAKDDYFSSMTSLLPISGEISGRGFLFSGSTLTDLINLGWRIETFNTTGVILGFMEPAIPKGQAFNFKNIFLFQKNSENCIVKHHVKWLEVIPYQLRFDSKGEISELLANNSIIERAANNAGLKEFFIPTSYEEVKFHAINRFIELWGNVSTKEIAITQFFRDENHKFMLTMHFGAKDIYPELVCYQIDSSSESIRPDFFVEKTNGMCEIVEFKLPRVTKPIVVGAKNKRHFASWFSTHLAQAKTYQRHFFDPRHQIDVKEKHGIEVENPTVTLVIGRRFDITTEVRTLLSEYPGINIMSYDDLVDGVVAQLYW